MANFLLAYTGGASMSDNPDDQKEAMDAWMGWFGSLGAAVVDGGAPFGPSTSIRPDGSTAAAASALTGYSILSAGSLTEAADLAKGCPVLANGGSVEVYEALPMG